jgi:NTP pyrophosphatase (non-canonical NTP hydrolase)
MFYLYHIPGKKIGVTRNLKNRVEKMQGYQPGEYQVLFATTDVDQISDMEVELQKTFGYKVDMNLYKDVIKKEPMKLNVTEQTTTFPVPKSKLKGRLMDMLGYEWETSLGTFKLTQEAANWIEHNATVSMFDKGRSFIYNKAFYEAFISEEALDLANDSNHPTVFDLIREWADERGIYTNGDDKTQYVKLMEESGELAKAILKQDQPEIIDAIGDMVVVLTNLAHLCGLSIEDCIDSAYNEIKDRKGKMDNGTFVKEL